MASATIRMKETVELSELRALADRLLPIEQGSRLLQPLERALIQVGVCASVTALNRGALKLAISRAYLDGATATHLQEIVSLVSGLGVHSLMISAAEILQRADDPSLNAPLSDEQRGLWDRYVGSSSFWNRFEQEMPGFLEAMLRLSAEQFVAFFDYCAIPWKGNAVSAVLKELTAMATDAVPGHRFLPGFRLHLGNAIKLGASRGMVFEALDIAANAPSHKGTP